MELNNLVMSCAEFNFFANARLDFISRSVEY